MRKALILLLMVLFTVSLTACGSKKSASPKVYGREEIKAEMGKAALEMDSILKANAN